MRNLIARLILGLVLISTDPAQAQYAEDRFAPPVQMLSATSASNAAVTLTIPASGAGLFHYLVDIQVTRTCTIAIIGSATLTVTTTNLPNTPSFVIGNACLIGSTNRDVTLHSVYPIKSTTANTNTTVTCQASGIAGVCHITATFFSSN